MPKKNRTKGNTRASSSGHSAELLSSWPAPPDLFGRDNDSFQVLSSPLWLQDDMNGLDDEIRLIMKKMIKKDAVTKLKALQEFIDYFNVEGHDIKTVLQIWLRLYNKLAMDCDNRVRESANRVQYMVATRTKDEILPFLKTAMATWVLAQCDSYPPAASAARNAFRCTFSLEEQSAALIMYKVEIIEMIEDNLYNHVPEAARDPNVMYDEDTLIACTLGGLKLFLTILNEEHRKHVQNRVQSIVSGKAFWFYTQNKSPQVCSASYALLSFLCAHMPDIFMDEKPQLILAVFQYLSVDDCNIGSAVWECALQILETFSDCWRHISPQKKVLPQIYNLLENGGKGRSSTVYPGLLPFISKLPKSVMSKNGFYREFFTRMRRSISRENFKLSASECNHLVKAFMECLQYSIDLTLSFSSFDQNVPEYLITEQLIPLIEMSLSPLSCHVASSSFYASIGTFLAHLEGHASKMTIKATQYDQILTIFWEHLWNLIETLVNEQHCMHNEEQFGTIASLFYYIHRPEEYTSRKRKSIRLNIEGEQYARNVQNASSSQSVRNYSKAQPCCCSEDSLLFKYTVELCVLLSRKVAHNLPVCCLNLCCKLLCTVNSSSIFDALVKRLDIPNFNESRRTPPYLFFTHMVQEWVKMASFDCAQLNSILDVTLCITSCLENEQASFEVLAACNRAQYKKLFCGLLTKYLKFDDRIDLFVDWILSRDFQTTLLSVMTKLKEILWSAEVTNPDPTQVDSYSKTIIACVEEQRYEDHRIPVIYIHYLMRECISFAMDFTTAFNSDGTTNKRDPYSFLEFVSNLCDIVVKNTQRCWGIPDYSQLVYIIFKISAENRKYCLPDSLASKIEDVWRASIRFEAFGDWQISAKQKFLDRTSSFLHCLLITSTHTTETLTHVIEFAATYLYEVGASTPDLESDKTFATALNHTVNSPDDWIKLGSQLKLSSVTTLLRKQLLYPVPIDDLTPECPLTLPELIYQAASVAELFVKLLLREGSSIPNGKIVEVILPHYRHLLWALCFVELAGFFKRPIEYEYEVATALKHNCMTLLNVVRPNLPGETQRQFLDFVTVLFQTTAPDVDPFDHFLALLDSLHYPLLVEDQPMVCSDVSGSSIDASVSPHIFHFKYSENVQGTVCSRFIGSNSNALSQIALMRSEIDVKIKYLKSLHKYILTKRNPKYKTEEYLAALAQIVSCIRNPAIFEDESVPQMIITFLSDCISDQRLFDNDESHRVEFVTSFSELLIAAIKNVPQHIDEDMWLSIISIVENWFQKCAGEPCNDPYVLNFLFSVHLACSLIYSIGTELQKEDSGQQGLFSSRATVRTVWQELFNDVVAPNIMSFAQIFSDLLQMELLMPEHELVMLSVCQVAQLLNVDQILRPSVESDNVFPTTAVSATDAAHQEAVDTAHAILSIFTSILSCCCLSAQLGTHGIICKIARHLPEVLRPSNQNMNIYKENENVLGLMPLIARYLEKTPVMLTSIEDNEIFKDVLIGPYTTRFSITVEYLLLAAEILEFFSSCSVEERVAYEPAIEKDVISTLMLVLIAVMPSNPASLEPATLPKGKIKYQQVFAELPSLALTAEPTAKLLQQIACHVYFSVLKKVPSLVRKWWNNLERNSELVENYTSKHVSGLLTNLEIQDVQKGLISYENMLVRARPTTGMVLATYIIGDHSVELTIQFPANYPLGQISADCPRNIGGFPQKFIVWLRQLHTSLNIKNVSVSNCLAVWKKNLDKEFLSAEECAICYTILHPDNLRLPEKTCPSCKKKFHNICTFKWINTSHNSTCPMCRNFL